MSSEVKQERLLVVFDFDHTLANGNTDTWITKMLPSLKQMISEHRKSGWCWTNIMDKAFSTLHGHGITMADYIKCFESLKFIDGMKETCSFLLSKNVPTIIISDSNSYFIDHLLARDSLQDVFRDIYTNPASWDDCGCLNVEHYHKHQCKVCPQNLCKRKVLQEHVAQSCQTYKHIVYVGDGHGDLCPCLALEHGDYILAREGYTLLNNLLGDRCDVKAEIVPWKSGFDILQLLRMLCE
ncbi:putative phosphatase phospho2 [Acropora cervicornis]|uniref:Phosphatase phospho2 n=1 Tax=Acropora cervicornis TaxID=6130 RepID=A0AAD9R031_ACRCE|nr:putative phosphatase phospho2 [Acropora cervicornis]